ncbi:hypothetical protein GCM10027610_084330 [Dactylosporangium cerinum]
MVALFTLSVPVAMIGTGLLLEAFHPPAAVTALASVLLAGVLVAGTRRNLRQARWPADNAQQ